MTAQRLRDDLARVAQPSVGVEGFGAAAGGILRRAVDLDGICLVTTDPATLVPTGEFVEDGLPERTFARMAEIEGAGHDCNAFATLARSGRATAALSHTTDGDLDRSIRHRELKAPHGFGDELRAVLADETGVWGWLTLLRRDDRPHFTRADTTKVEGASGTLAEGLRRAVLATEPPSGGDAPGSTGVMVLAPDGSIASADAGARAWLDAPGCAPRTVRSVADRARAGANGAHARVRAPDGGWLVLRGSRLGTDAEGMVAVTLEPARPRDLAPLAADAYGLTPRERAVTRLVAEGLPTTAIAARLHLSAWTVQDHLKAIFEKVGVTTRGALVAHVFFDRRPPLL